MAESIRLLVAKAPGIANDAMLVDVSEEIRDVDAALLYERIKHPVVAFGKA